MYEHCFVTIIPIFCNSFYYPHKFFKKFHKTLVKRLTGGILPVMEPDKRLDGEKARAKEWLLTSRKDGNLHAWGLISATKVGVGRNDKPVTTHSPQPCW